MKTGERAIKDNKQFKHIAGRSANGTANTYLSNLRGKKVCVACGDVRYEGILESFDLYSIKLIAGDTAILIFKGPGVVVMSDDA